MAPTGPVSRCRSCCETEKPDRTPQPTTSPCCGRRSRSCPDTSPAGGPAGRCWLVRADGGRRHPRAAVLADRALCSTRSGSACPTPSQPSWPCWTPAWGTGAPSDLGRTAVPLRPNPRSQRLPPQVRGVYLATGLFVRMLLKGQFAAKLPEGRRARPSCSGRRWPGR